MAVRREPRCVNSGQLVEVSCTALEVPQTTPLLGEAHRDVLGNAMNIAVLNGRIGNDVAALDAYRRVHDVAGRVLAPHDAMRAAALEGMASALVRLARAAEALPLCQQAVQIRTAHGVAADIARARVCMADAYLGLGRADLAVVEARAAEQIATATLGPSHPDRARYQEVVATCEARMRAR